MSRDWSVLIQDSEDRVIGCYPLAVCEGRCGAEADMRSPPRCAADVLLDDGCSTFKGNLFEPHVAPPTANDVGLALGSDVLYPFTLSEHRHEIVPALIPGYDDCDGVGTTRSPPLYLQSYLPARWQPEGRPRRPKAGECFTQARSSPALVETRDGNDPKRLG
jgi:hypothetical protein